MEYKGKHGLSITCRNFSANLNNLYDWTYGNNDNELFGRSIGPYGPYYIGIPTGAFGPYNGNPIGYAVHPYLPQTRTASFEESYEQSEESSEESFERSGM